MAACSHPVTFVVGMESVAQSASRVPGLASRWNPKATRPLTRVESAPPQKSVPLMQHFSPRDFPSATLAAALQRGDSADGVSPPDVPDSRGGEGVCQALVVLVAAPGLESP